MQLELETNVSNGWVSVAAALCTYTLAQRVRQSDYPWQLPPEEQFELRIQWTRQAVSRWLQHLDREYQRYLDGDRSDLPANGDPAVSDDDDEVTAADER